MRKVRRLVQTTRIFSSVGSKTISITHSNTMFEHENSVSLRECPRSPKDEQQCGILMRKFSR